MSDIVITFKAAALGKSLDNLAFEVEEELNAAVQNVAGMAFASIQAHAQTELNSTRQDYLKGLDFQKIGVNSYLISLEGEIPNALERGYPAFNMRDAMLKSEKVVAVGPRAGQKWVQQSAEDGHKFAHVPIDHHPFSKAAASSDLNQAIQKLKAFNRQGLEQKFTSLFKDDSGNPLQGKVARSGKVPGFPDLDGITKYQKTNKNPETGKTHTESIYITYRTISENGHAWMHPGHSGVHFFDEAEKWLDAEIDNILTRLIK